MASNDTRVALFVDVEDIYANLARANLTLEPDTILEPARRYGKVERAIAYADFSEPLVDLRTTFEDAGVDTVHTRHNGAHSVPGRTMPVTRDAAIVRMVVDLLDSVADEKAADVYVIASSDERLRKAIDLARDRYDRRIVLIAVPGTVSRDLESAVAEVETLDMPQPVPPPVPSGGDGMAPMSEQPLPGMLAPPGAELTLGMLVPALAQLETRKRYLNFNYIREGLLRDHGLELHSRDHADSFLSEAIEIGLILKRKIEDRYHPGQFFTCYVLNRDHDLVRDLRPNLPPAAIERFRASEDGVPVEEEDGGELPPWTPPGLPADPEPAFPPGAGYDRPRGSGRFSSQSGRHGGQGGWQGRDPRRSSGRHRPGYAGGGSGGGQRRGSGRYAGGTGGSGRYASGRSTGDYWRDSGRLPRGARESGYLGVYRGGPADDYPRRRSSGRQPGLPRDDDEPETPPPTSDVSDESDDE